MIKDEGLKLTKTLTHYYYDAFGRRIAKTAKVETLNKVNQRGQLVKYPSNLQQLRKTDKTQHHTTFMLWDGNRQLQEYTHHHIFTTIYDQDSFEPVSRVVQSRDKDCDDLKIYHYHNNHLGTPQELTNEQGEMVWLNYEFAWGGRYTHHYTTQSLNGCNILEHELQPIRFQGQYYDPETSLHYNRFHYYDSDVGMFIQRDPIGLLGGLNTFQYAPNPIGWVDPWGLSNKPCSKANDVIDETLNSKKKNLVSQYTVNSDEALEAGQKFIGNNYTEIGKKGSGVFRSNVTDANGNYRQFRIDNGSLSGSHDPFVPHVHLEIYKPNAPKPFVNNHIPLKD